MPKKKRVIFQIRLSTGIVLMLAGGALLGLHIKSGGCPFGVLDWQERICWPGLLVDVLFSLGLLLFLAIAANVWMAAAEGDRYDSEN